MTKYNITIPLKNNISYYRHEVHSHNHWKFKVLRKKYGWAGEGKFWALNNIIAASENCYLDISTEAKKISVAVDLDFDLVEFEEFINFLISNCKLIKFVDTDIFTNDIIQETLVMASGKREKQKEWIKNKRSITENELSISENGLSKPTNELSTVDNEQRKEKKRKEIYNSPNEPIKTFKNWSEEKFKEDINKHKEVLELPPDEKKELLNAFFFHWNEKSTNGKMLFQLQKSWETRKRLVTWYNNKIAWSNNKFK